MTTNKFKIIAIAVVCAITVSNNDDNNGDAMVSADFTGTFVQQDQMARPAINTVFLLRDNLKMTLMLHSFCNGCKVPAIFNLDYLL
jgi:hypothetical protein